MIGIARGGNSNFSNTMMSTLTGERAAVGYNLLHGAFAVGAVLSPMALVACASRSSNGWRLMGYGIIALCVLQVVVYSRMALPEEKVTGSIKSVDKRFLKSKSFWLGSAILFFYISVEYAICTWLVTYFKDSGYLSANTSQMMTSLLWVVMFIGRMAGAYLVGKVPRKALLVVDGVGLTAFFLLVFFSRSQAPIFIGIMGVGLFMATSTPPPWLWAPRRFGAMTWVSVIWYSSAASAASSPRPWWEWWQKRPGSTLGWAWWSASLFCCSSPSFAACL